MQWTERVYEAAVRTGRPALRLASAFNDKLARGLAGRRGVAERFARWAACDRDTARPLLWFHAPSAGEALMAQAMIDAVRRMRPDVQIAFTFFSPSAERIVPRIDADVSDYVPWDIAADVIRVLEALRPAAIAFVRSEVWPILAREARARGVRLALVNAVIGPESSRLRPAARLLLRPAYTRLDAVGVVRQDDAERLTRLGVEPRRIHVSGDARFDQVLRRIERLDRVSPLLSLFDGPEPLVVAGSTWPPDESRLIEALARARASVRARLVIAPHEPTEDHLHKLELRVRAAGLASETLAMAEAAGRVTRDITIVDRVGVLADLYARADIAYVGGGFGRTGLHSVIEPAALGVPVLFGPRAGNTREAHDLLRVGGGFEVQDAGSIERRLVELIENPGARRLAGAAALAFVQAGRNGAERNAALVLALLG